MNVAIVHEPCMSSPGIIPHDAVPIALPTIKCTKHASRKEHEVGRGSAMSGVTAATSRSYIPSWLMTRCPHKDCRHPPHLSAHMVSPIAPSYVTVPPPPLLISSVYSKPYPGPQPCHALFCHPPSGLSCFCPALGPACSGRDQDGMGPGVPAVIGAVRREEGQRDTQAARSLQHDVNISLLGPARLTPSLPPSHAAVFVCMCYLTHRDG